MTAPLERRSQGCLVRAPVQAAWRDVAAGARTAVLTRSYVYNARSVCAGAALELWASLPALAEVESRRRAWLLAEVGRFTGRREPPRRGGPRGR